MFAGYRDEVDGPTAADDGVFIPQKQLQTWWKTLQKKFPGIYPPNEVSERSERERGRRPRNGRRPMHL